MRAVYYEAFGPADVLRLGDRPKPVPGPGEVLVQVAAASINPIDRRLRAGELQPYFSREFPIIPGFDLAGRIVALGPQVTGWEIGEPVAGLASTWHLHDGTCAEYVPVSVTSITRKPERLSFAQAACLPLVALTAWQAIVEEAEIRRGQSVFIQAGAGGLGSVAATIARHFGARVYATGSTANLDYLRACGVDHPIDYTREDYATRLRQLEPDGIDMVLESLEGDQIARTDTALTKSGGSIVFMNAPPPEVPDFARRNIHTLFLHHRPDGAMLGGLLERFAHGALVLPAIESVPLDQAIEAHRRSEAGRTRGKLVLEIASL